MAKKKSKAPTSKNKITAKPEQPIVEVAHSPSFSETIRQTQIVGLLPLLGAAIVLVLVVFAFVLGRVQNIPNSQQSLSSLSFSSASSSLSMASPIESFSSSATSSLTSNSTSNTSTETVSPGRVSTGNSGSTTTATYTFTAGKGESVSKLARKAINQYLTERGSTLDRAQRLFMEVSLTNVNNPVHMQVGESRTFSVTQISSLYDQALNLSSRSFGAWERQAASVNFR